MHVSQFDKFDPYETSPVTQTNAMEMSYLSAVNIAAWTGAIYLSEISSDPLKVVLNKWATTLSAYPALHHCCKFLSAGNSRHIVKLK